MEKVFHNTTRKEKQKMPHPAEMFAKMMRDRGWVDKDMSLRPQSKDPFYLQGYFRGSYPSTDENLLVGLKKKEWWEI